MTMTTPVHRGGSPSSRPRFLALVAVLAAWSGFASAKWGTESSLKLAKATAARNVANRADTGALNTKNFDASTFNAWFSAYAVGQSAGRTRGQTPVPVRSSPRIQGLVRHRPCTNPNAPKGPTYMPQYVQPGLAETKPSMPTADRPLRPGVTGGRTLGRLRPHHRASWPPSCSWSASAATSSVRSARVGLIAVGGQIAGRPRSSS